MEDRCNSRPLATLALATVARQFAGSRIERQVLTQVFDVVWKAGRCRAWHMPSGSSQSDSATAHAGLVGRDKEGSIS